MKPAEAPKLAVVAPREMSRDDRRIIFAKLNDVYLDEKRGYSDGWNDERVAADLNVPRKWVEDIRADNFGDAHDNEELRKFLDQLGEVREMLGKVQTRLTVAEAEHAQLRNALSGINELVVSCQKDLNSNNSKLANVVNLAKRLTPQARPRP